MKIFKKWQTTFLLIFIFAIGFILRTYNLGHIPVGFHRDEAFLGYNAFSLLQTGRDMTGNLLPLHLQSFLYSPAGYSYFSIPFIQLFGLNEFSVRFASALLGSATIILVYFLTVALFYTYQHKSQLGLLSAFFLAISPWHINLSRVATENVIVVFFITLGTIVYLLWVRQKKLWLLFVAFFCFGLTLFIYQAPRSFLPFFLPLLFLCFHPKLNVKNITQVSAIFFLVILIPIITILSSHDLSQRIRMLSIFNHPETQLVLNEQIREDGVGGSPLILTRFFDNKIVSYSSTFLANYFTHFTYDFLFTDKGVPDRFRVPNMGLLYLFELPFLIFGIWKMLMIDKKITVFLLGWILFAPVGSALTFDDIPNLQRTLIAFPALSIVSAYGFIHIWKLISSLKYAVIVKAVIIFIIIYSVAFYLHQYYIHQVHHRPWYRQEGYRQLVIELNKQFPQAKKIVITDKETDPAIFFFFYNAVNPGLTQQIFISHPTEHYGEMGFGKYNFSHEECPLHETPEFDSKTNKMKYILNGKRDIVYVNLGTCNIEHNKNKINTSSEIKRSDNTTVFKIQTIK